MPITDDIATHAAWVEDALRQSGYVVDKTAASLWEVERFLEEQSVAGRPVAGGALDGQLGAKLFALGAYVGEVMRRELGGQWHADDAAEDGEISAELHLENGTRCWPIERVIKRFKNGGEDSIAAYGIGLGLAIGRRDRRR